MSTGVPRDHPPMPRSWVGAVALAVLLVTTACGVLPRDEAAPEAEGAAVHLESQLASFRDRLAALELETQGFERESRIAARRAEQAVTALRKRLDRLAGTVEGARAGVDDAVAQVQSAVRDLSLLTERYDFHMRRYHGGQ